MSWFMLGVLMGTTHIITLETSSPDSITPGPALAPVIDGQHCYKLRLYTG